MWNKISISLISSSMTRKGEKELGRLSPSISLGFPTKASAQEPNSFPITDSIPAAVETGNPYLLQQISVCF